MLKKLVSTPQYVYWPPLPQKANAIQCATWHKFTTIAVKKRVSLTSTGRCAPPLRLWARDIGEVTTKRGKTPCDFLSKKKETLQALSLQRRSFHAPAHTHTHSARWLTRDRLRHGPHRLLRQKQNGECQASTPRKGPFMSNTPAGGNRDGVYKHTPN